MKTISFFQLIVVAITALANIHCQNGMINERHFYKELQRITPWEARTFVVGGEDVTNVDPFAYSVVGIINMEKGSLCTGTLIDRSHVLTAAHCLPHNVNSLRVFTGLSKKDKTSVLDAVSFVATPQWQTRSSEEMDRGDLAIIKFTGDLPRQYKGIEFVSPSFLKEGDQVLIAGYGRSDGVKKVGTGTLRKTYLQVANPYHGETEVLFDQSQGKGACHGDSGGPAFLVTAKGVYQWGVTSREYKDPAKDCTHYSIYSKIEPYLDWINQSLRDTNF